MTDEGSRVWFRARRDGYGWVPAAWQGWGVLALYVTFVLMAARRILVGEEGGVPGVKRFLGSVLALTLLLVYVAWAHGEPLAWGRKTPNDHEPS